MAWRPVPSGGAGKGPDPKRTSYSLHLEQSETAMHDPGAATSCVGLMSGARSPRSSHGATGYAPPRFWRSKHAEKWRRIRLEPTEHSYWRVTFDHPPLDILGPETIPQLNEITALETDSDGEGCCLPTAREIANGLFSDALQASAPSSRARLAPNAAGLSPLPDALVRLSHAQVVSIASIRGAPRPASEASSRSRPICASPVLNGPSCRN